ncbi:RNA polymerase sigma-70 factor, ECF subfamily [Rhodoferax sp. OV413]|uniref:sigma-70 family RNA polymerase sigma factor n=1 Tax=Rhodoferax sp. OV413 TaxID=1855285 RepID=UPI00088B8B40|nr:sigma-70 family RNA polymerase sigma factor [Rhodoferax sp. OV413]SDO87345.1 RNA polymerase sigma-70 factor, ECF subfamily [Rhodoferax sp. OV413]
MPSPPPLALLHHARQMFAEHHGWLLTRLQARLHNTADAQDLASETFLRVVTYRQLDAVHEPRAFLTTIAKRLLFTLWRRRELEQAYLDALALRPDDTAASPEDRAVLLETLDYIAHALDGLPLKAHQAFLLSQMDGLGYHAIAAQLGISHSTVRRHMADAFRRIALALARQQAGIAEPSRTLKR